MKKIGKIRILDLWGGLSAAHDVIQVVHALAMHKAEESWLMYINTDDEGSTCCHRHHHNIRLLSNRPTQYILLIKWESVGRVVILVVLYHVFMVWGCNSGLLVGNSISVIA